VKDTDFTAKLVDVYPDGRAFNAPAAPVRFVGADDGPKGPSPRPGEHTRAVLAELGYGEAEIAAMYESGAAA